MHHFSIDRRDRTGTDYSRRWWEWGTIAAAVPCSSHMSNQTCRHNRPGMYSVSLAPPIWSCVKQGAHDHCHDPKGEPKKGRFISSYNETLVWARIEQGSNPCFHVMCVVWICCVIRLALARRCKVEESMRTTTTTKGARAGKEGREGGGAVLVAGGKKSTLPPLFCRTRAVRSIGLPQLHAATLARRGREEGETVREREREREGISHLRTSKLFHRSLARPAAVAATLGSFDGSGA